MPSKRSSLSRSPLPRGTATARTRLATAAWANIAHLIRGGIKDLGRGRGVGSGYSAPLLRSANRRQAHRRDGLSVGNQRGGRRQGLELGICVHQLEGLLPNQGLIWLSSTWPPGPFRKASQDPSSNGIRIYMSHADGFSRSGVDIARCRVFHAQQRRDIALEFPYSAAPTATAAG